MIRRAFLISVSALLFFNVCDLQAQPKKTPENNQTTVNKMRVIVDTDMGFDDWLAILYLAKNPNVDIKAVTVVCNGETECPQGGHNATKLLQLATGKTNIPVYVGRNNFKNSWRDFPPIVRQFATRMRVNCYNEPKQPCPLPKNITGYPFNGIGTAAQAIVDIAQSNEDISIISIGPTTNIADAIDKGLRKNDIKMLYRGGGVFGTLLKQTPKDEVEISNYSIKGNVSIKGIFATNNDTSEWNIYPDAEALNKVIEYHFPITYVPLNLTASVNITEASFNQLKQYDKGHKNAALYFVLNDVYSQVVAEGGFVSADMSYWDPSVAVAATNPLFLQNTKKVKHTYKNKVCVQHRLNAEPEVVGYESSFAGSYPYYAFKRPSGKEKYYYGTVLVGKQCKQLNLKQQESTIYYSIDPQNFYNEFTRVLAL